MEIPIEYIIEIGLLRKRGVCAFCKGKMDVKEPNIQLCKFCRQQSLKQFANGGSQE